MRVAIIAAAIALASTPAIASPSCMTQSEARTKFPKEHLWWHGANRCWDATPSRARLGQRLRAKEPQQTSGKEVERQAQEIPKKPRWRDAMSRMRSDDMPDAAVAASAGASVDATAAPLVAPRANFFERWVEIAQRVPPAAPRTDRTANQAADQTADRAALPSDLAADARAAEPLVTPIRVMLGLLVLLLAFGVFELVVRWPARRTDPQ